MTEYEWRDGWLYERFGPGDTWFVCHDGVTIRALVARVDALEAEVRALRAKVKE